MEGVMEEVGMIKGERAMEEAREEGVMRDGASDTGDGWRRDT